MQRQYRKCVNCHDSKWGRIPVCFWCVRAYVFGILSLLVAGAAGELGRRAVLYLLP